MNVYQSLEREGLALPPATQPVGSFAMAIQTGDLVFVSGHIAKRDGAVWQGRLGVDMATSDGQQAAHAVGLDILATLDAFLGNLNRVTRVVRLECLVNSSADFTEQHLVANGCSDLMKRVFGESGLHARAAYGVAAVPLGSCVEITAMVQVSPWREPNEGLP
jgi:enamine deaminase RidA (YjgF/YER057c/UK114 family)